MEVGGGTEESPWNDEWRWVEGCPNVLTWALTMHELDSLHKHNLHQHHIIVERRCVILLASDDSTTDVAVLCSKSVLTHPVLVMSHTLTGDDTRLSPLGQFCEVLIIISMLATLIHPPVKFPRVRLMLHLDESTLQIRE